MDARNTLDLTALMAFRIIIYLDWGMYAHVLNTNKHLMHNIFCTQPLDDEGVFFDLHLPLVQACSRSLNFSYILNGNFVSESQGITLTGLCICLLSQELATI
jgi:hypothetical protein